MAGKKYRQNVNRPPNGKNIRKNRKLVFNHLIIIYSSNRRNNNIFKKRKNDEYVIVGRAITGICQDANRYGKKYSDISR
jgi:hypothetical protein